jgi:hypothetical protein
MVSLPYGLKLKNTLHSHSSFHGLINEISGVLKEIHALEDLKNDPELLLLICNLVENAPQLVKNKWRLDKKELCLSIHENLFNSTEEEKVLLRQSIQFFYDNGKIKRKKWWKLLTIYAMDWIKRKFL